MFWAGLALAFIFFLFPLYWMIITSIKARTEVTLLPPTYFPFLDFRPVVDNYLAVFTKASELGTITASTTARNFEMRAFPGILASSILIGGSTTVLVVLLGTLAAYAFSRFRIQGEGDLLFFILSTRMLPPIVVLIPIFLMFNAVNLRESYIGITLL